jgi:RecB family exonuclease
MEIPAAVRALAPWSPSMANQVLNCPHAFHRKYILKEKSKEPDSVASTVGTVVHKILEWVLLDVSVDKAFAKALETYELTHEAEMLVQTYRQAVEDFLRGIEEFDRQVGIHKILAEQKVALTPDWRPTQFFSRDGLIRGVVDVIIVTKDRRAIVIDHKTGVVKPISKYQEQTETYSVFVDALITGLSGVRMAIHYVGSDPNAKGTRTMWAPEYGVDVVRTRFKQNLIDYLARAAEAAESSEPNECWLCNFCGYQSVCPAKT